MALLFRFIRPRLGLTMHGNGLDVLALWSLVALIFRFSAIGVLLYVARLQFKEFKYQSSLQPLKRILFHFVILIIISNLPIMYLHYVRIIGQTASPGITAFATASNALATLVVAILLLMVYKFKGNDE